MVIAIGNILIEATGFVKLIPTAAEGKNVGAIHELPLQGTVGARLGGLQPTRTAVC